MEVKDLKISRYCGFLPVMVGFAFERELTCWVLLQKQQENFSSTLVDVIYCSTFVDII